MALMIAEVYDAFLEAGASEEKARKAAEAIAAYDDRLQRVERRLEVLTYMVGTNTALTVLTLSGIIGILWRLVKI